MSMVTLEVQGLEEALAALRLNVEAQLGQAEDRFLRTGVEVARSATPVVTGAMRGAWQWNRAGVEGKIEINSSAVNPRSGVPVTEYAPTVDARLGILDLVSSRLGTMDIEGVGWE